MRSLLVLLLATLLLSVHGLKANIQPVASDFVEGPCVSKQVLVSGTPTLVLAQSRKTDNSLMSYSFCINQCVANGWRIAGVTEGNRCYCGNVWNTPTAPSLLDATANCNLNCPGDNTKKCGGANAFRILTNKATVFAISNGKDPSTTFRNYVRIGCYSDTQQNRMLDNGYIRDETRVTPSFCKNYQQTQNTGVYKYIGLEDGYECFWSDTFSTTIPHPSALDTTCNTPCVADTTSTCGGQDRVEVYQISDLTYLGCITDDVNNRMFSMQTFYPDDGMTQQKCFDWCNRNKYAYSGLQFGTQCFCGDSLPSTGYPLVADSECNMACGGSPTQKCGGPARMSVFIRETFVPPVTVTSVAYNGLTWTRQGCYSDNNGGQRILNELPYYSYTMTNTPAACVQLCSDAGFTYAGTEYSGECFCGNTINNSGTSTPDADCHMLCNGDTTKFCGGSGRIEIYKKPTP